MLSPKQSDSVYVAGIDLAGEAETEPDDYLKSLKPRLDSTVITIGQLVQSTSLQGVALQNSSPSPVTHNYHLNIVEHYSFNGIKHPDLYACLVDLLKNVWHCKRIVVDSTGIGQPVVSFLRRALGSRVVPFVFTPSAKTGLGFNLLAALNSGSLKMYAADNSPEYQEFWFEMEKARSLYRPNRTMNFYVDPADGHDDFLMSLALVVEAANIFTPREARGN